MQRASRHDSSKSNLTIWEAMRKFLMAKGTSVIAGVCWSSCMSVRWAQNITCWQQTCKLVSSICTPTRRLNAVFMKSASSLSSRDLHCLISGALRMQITQELRDYAQKHQLDEQEAAQVGPAGMS